VLHLVYRADTMCVLVSREAGPDVERSYVNSPTGANSNLDSRRFRRQ
jgi:hypothetical protein